MTSCLIAVSGNIDPLRWLPIAVRRLGDFARVEATSPFFITPPLRRSGQPDYRNGVLRCQSELQPRALKFDVLRVIEAECGRVRGEDAYAARTVDLDLLDWGGIILNESGLRLPDPDLLERPFLAAAVLSIDPEYTLPGIGLLSNRFDCAALKAYPVDVPLTRTIEEIITHEPGTSQ
ncbi:MAG: 2-amino-4-hydroxy-6-hydroxymethyldihydropteridine diphosphokinase [Candidatus Hydrogenedentes bacterium]|nr:2-amino-4-hydroxy-6-hydroxymethyldihydropteridine diphosphokinase [Candidatus Hydrogenedentota bacterium]